MIQKFENIIAAFLPLQQPLQRRQRLLRQPQQQNQLQQRLLQRPLAPRKQRGLGKNLEPVLKRVKHLVKNAEE